MCFVKVNSEKRFILVNPEAERGTYISPIDQPRDDRSDCHKSPKYEDDIISSPFEVPVVNNCLAIIPVAPCPSQVVTRSRRLREANKVKPSLPPPVTLNGPAHNLRSRVVASECDMEKAAVLILNTLEQNNVKF